MKKKIKQEELIDLNEIFTLIWRGKIIIIFSILISISVFHFYEKNSKSVGSNILYLNDNFNLINKFYNVNVDVSKNNFDKTFENDILKFLSFDLQNDILFEKFVHYIITENKNIYPKNLSKMNFKSFGVQNYNTKNGIINLKFTWKDFEEGEKIFNEIISNSINKVKNEMVDTVLLNFNLKELAIKESLKLISLKKKLLEDTALKEKKELLLILENRKNFAEIIVNSDFYKKLSENEKINLLNQNYKVSMNNDNFQVDLSQNLGNLALLDVYLGVNPDIINQNIKFISSMTPKEFLLLSSTYQKLNQEEKSIMNELEINENLLASSSRLINSIDFQNMFLYNTNFKNEKPLNLNKLFLFILLGIFIGFSILYFREKK